MTANLKPDVAMFVRPLDKPLVTACAEHGADCALEQHYALVARIDGNRADEQVMGIVTARGHE